jgi:hypothetical protein
MDAFMGATGRCVQARFTREFLLQITYAPNLGKVDFSDQNRSLFSTYAERFFAKP